MASDVAIVKTESIQNEKENELSKLLKFKERVIPLMKELKKVNTQLKDENEQLKIKIEQMKEKEIQFNSLQQENEELKTKLTNYVKTSNENLSKKDLQIKSLILQNENYAKKTSDESHKNFFDTANLIEMATPVNFEETNRKISNQKISPEKIVLEANEFKVLKNENMLKEFNDLSPMKSNDLICKKKKEFKLENNSQIVKVKVNNSTSLNIKENIKIEMNLEEQERENRVEPNIVTKKENNNSPKSERVRKREVKKDTEEIDVKRKRKEKNSVYLCRLLDYYIQNESKKSTVLETLKINHSQIPYDVLAVEISNHIETSVEKLLQNTEKFVEKKDDIHSSQLVDLARSYADFINTVLNKKIYPSEFLYLCLHSLVKAVIYPLEETEISKRDQLAMVKTRTYETIIPLVYSSLQEVYQVVRCLVHSFLVVNEQMVHISRIFVFDMLYHMQYIEYSCLSAIAQIIPETFTSDLEHNLIGAVIEILITNSILLEDETIPNVKRERIHFEYVKSRCKWNIWKDNRKDNILELVNMLVDIVFKKEKDKEKDKENEMFFSYSLSTQSYNAIKGLQLIAMNYGWEWSYAYLVENHLNRLLQSYETIDFKIKACRLIGKIGKTCLLEENTQITLIEKKLIELLMTKEKDEQKISLFPLKVALVTSLLDLNLVFPSSIVSNSVIKWFTNLTLEKKMDLPNSLCRRIHTLFLND